MGQKDKEWGGKTWVERPQVVLGAGWALFSLASLDLSPVRRVWSSNPARTPGRESEYEGRLSGRLDTEDTHKVNHCVGYTSHLHLSETGENCVPTSASPSHSRPQRELLSLDRGGDTSPESESHSTRTVR